jgi:putative phosphoribosyl transferase
MANLFHDRAEAGQLLATRLGYFSQRPDVLVLALTREGLSVAADVARELGAPLDLFPSQRVNVPGRADLAMGAMASGGVLVMNDQIVHLLNISDDTIGAEALDVAGELVQQEKLCRAGHPPVNVRERVVILVDDGLADALVIRAAAVSLRRQDPVGILVALPVARPEVCAELESAAEQVICLQTPEPLYSIGLHYRHFPKITDAEVRAMLLQSVDDLASRPASERRIAI